MKISLFYYTGTNNTLHLCNELISLINNDNQIELINCFDKEANQKLVGSDLVFFVFPVHAFNVPFHFVSSLKKLNKVENTRAFIISNSGEGLKINDNAFFKSGKILRKKGYKVIGQERFIMPYNIIFKYDEKLVSYLEAANYEHLIKTLDLALNNQTEIKKKYVLSKVFTDFLKIEYLAGPLNSSFYKVDSKKCINCQKCINTCHLRNIYQKNGKIKFHHHCDICMNCSFNCPQDAIRIGILNKWRVNGKYKFNRTINKDEKYLSDLSQKRFYKKIVKYINSYL